jgi:hypothetical protein
MVTVSAKLADGRSISAKLPEVNTIPEAIAAPATLHVSCVAANIADIDSRSV